MSSGDEEPKAAPAEEKKGGRGRPAKKEAAKRPAEAGDAGASAPKKGRGRPKGSESKAKKAAKPKVRLSCGAVLQAFVGRHANGRPVLRPLHRA
jgi:hypothetical protein